MTDTRANVAVVVLTFNEAQNVEACLSSVTGWAREVFVVDSGSTDETAAIARRNGAKVVSHPFESHARQWRWALDELPIQSAWVLALDADQRVSPELKESVIAALDAPGEADGFYVNRRQIFRGRWIRHGGYYPKYLLKLFRRSAVRLEPRDLVDHHFYVEGTVGTLTGDLIEDNQNELRIADWIAKHNRYAERQAREELDRLAHDAPDGRPFGTPDERTIWRKRLWRRLPLYLRPFFYFIYRYVFRLGFLDGREGFVFHFMQAWWYRMLVDINREELRSEFPASRAPRRPVSDPDPRSDSTSPAVRQ